MRLIDVDVLRKDLEMAENCDDCPRSHFECCARLYSARDFCEKIDEVPIVTNTQKGEQTGF